MYAYQDTVVRWSAAKGVARISERLPGEFTRQVVDTVIGLFSIQCAELLRRSLIPHDRLADVIDWMIKVIF